MSKKKELEVILYIGVPASGKSTMAKEFIKKNPNYVRVSRDDFRYMLKDQGFCEPKIESLITELQNNVILNALAKNLNVIVDNTNVKLKTINEFIKLCQEYANISYRVFDVPLKTCLERDKIREKSVGEDVIKRMYKDYEILKDSFDFQPVNKLKYIPPIEPDFKSELPAAVAFDLDGTLCLSKGRRSMFDFSRVDVDDLNEIVGEQVKFHKSLGRKIIIMSGRDESCKEMSEEWLKFYGVEYDMIFMRPKDDVRRDSIVKKELYENNIKGKYNLLAVIDDRLQVLDMWYKESIFTFSVNQGNKIF